MSEFEMRKKRGPNIFLRILGLIGAAASAGWGAYLVRSNYRIMNAFIRYNVFPVTKILSGAFLCLFPFILALACIFFAFGDGIKAGGTLAIALVIYGASAVMNYADMQQVRNFRHVRYPSYLNSEPRKTLVDKQECDYDEAESIKIECYFTFLGSNFRDMENIEVIYNEDLTDSFAIEILYRGTECEMYSDYFHEEEDDPNVYRAYISMFYTDRSYYDMTPKDYAMMYKYREDLRYEYSYVVEKINVYTAFPEKFDLSEVRSY